MQRKGTHYGDDPDYTKPIGFIILSKHILLFKYILYYTFTYSRVIQSYTVLELAM